MRSGDVADACPSPSTLTASLLPSRKKLETKSPVSTLNRWMPRPWCEKVAVIFRLSAAPPLSFYWCNFHVFQQFELQNMKPSAHLISTLRWVSPSGSINMIFEGSLERTKKRHLREQSSIFKSKQLNYLRKMSTSKLGKQRGPRIRNFVRPWTDDFPSLFPIFVSGRMNSWPWLCWRPCTTTMLFHS